MGKLNDLYCNKWVRFSFWTILYVLIFVIWSRSPFSIVGVAFIYDYFISKIYKKLFWNKHTRIKENNKSYRFLMGWVEAIVFALVVASLIRGYFVEMYVIPSPSMEKTLLVGDYIAVSKVAYGPKMPNTPIAMPLVHNTNPFSSSAKSYVEWIKRPYKRLAGLGDIVRGDVVVFNYPQGDTVLVESPQDNYYALKRRYGKEYLESVSKIISHPIDKRDNYIKRVVGLPGDRIEIADGMLYVNGEPEAKLPTRQYIYNVQTNPNIITRALLENLDIPEANILSLTANHFSAFMTEEQAARIGSTMGVQNVQQYIKTITDADVFPYDTTQYPFTEHNMFLTIPQRGMTVGLNIYELPILERIISVYENKKLEVRGDGSIYIDGLLSDSYTFEQNYFFAMGDNRDNSLDSRFFGFIPEDHIVGKASFIWFSIDNTKSFPKNIRFNRIGKLIE